MNVPGGVGLQHGARHARRVEQRTLRKSQVRVAVAQYIANRHGDDVAAGVRVFPVGPGGKGGLPAGHEPCDVADAEQHPHDIRARAVLALLEAKAAAHAEEMVDRDPRPGIPRPLPLRNRSGCVDRQSTLADENADERIHDTLGHRPARERRVGPDPGLVAFSNDPSALQHDDGARSARVPRVRFVERSRNHRVQLRPWMAGNAMLGRRRSSAVAGSGGHFGGAIACRQPGRREVVELERAPEALTIDSTAFDAQRPGGDGVRDGVYRCIDILQDGEIVHLKVCQDRRRGTLRHEHPEQSTLALWPTPTDSTGWHEPGDCSERKYEPDSDRGENQPPDSARHRPSSCRAVGLISSEGLRPSDSPTRSLARRSDGALRSRGSLASARSRLLRWLLVESVTPRCPDAKAFDLTPQIFRTPCNRRPPRAS